MDQLQRGIKADLLNEWRQEPEPLDTPGREFLGVRINEHLLDELEKAAGKHDVSTFVRSALADAVGGDAP